MSKKHSNRNKELDLQVVNLLNSQGIFNQVRAKTLSNLANEVQSSSLDSIKCYKTIKNDNDYKIANEIVFEYLKRHNMENTINCIQSETENKLRPTPISNDIQNNLNISQKENVLHHVMQFYNGNIDDIFAKYHESLINDINERIQNIGKSKPKSSEAKTSPKATTAPISKSNSKASVGQDQNSKTQNPTKKDESSSIEFDLNDDDIPTPSKSPTNPTSSTQKVKSESSELAFDDTSDFDKPATSKPAAKPASNTQPTQPVKKVSDSEFSDFDDDLELEDNATPSPKQTKSANQSKPKNDEDDFDVDLDDDIASLPKQNKSPNQSKPKNEMDDFFDDEQEPPLINNNAAKPLAKNDDFDDSLQDFDDSL